MRVKIALSGHLVPTPGRLEKCAHTKADYDDRVVRPAPRWIENHLKIRCEVCVGGDEDAVEGLWAILKRGRPSLAMRTAKLECTSLGCRGCRVGPSYVVDIHWISFQEYAF
jgi:hypothetical protein